MFKKLFFITTLLVVATLSMAQLNTDRLLSVGRNALYFEDYVLSIQYFNQVIKAKPYLVDPYFYRAVAKIELEDFVGAEHDLDIVIQRNPFIPLAYYARAFCYKRSERWELAERDLTMALQYSPDNYIYMINRVEAFEEQKKFEEAMRDLEFVWRRNGENIDLLGEIGRLYLEMGDTAESLNCFDKIVDIDSLNANAWSAKGLVNLIVGNEDIAFYAYNKSVQLRSSNVSTYINRGILHYKRRNYRGAMDDYNRAVELDSVNDHALYNRALLRVELGDLNNAITDLNRVIDLNNDMLEAVYERAVVNQRLGNHKDAVFDLNTIISRYPKFLPAIYMRGESFLSLGRKKEAFDDMEMARTLREEMRKEKKTGISHKSDTLNTDVKISNEENSIIKNRASLFASNASSQSEFSSLRGAIQNMDVTLENEPNIQLSYYKKQGDAVFTREYRNDALSELNNRGVLAKLYLVCEEVSLTEGMIGYHFNSIDRLSLRINEDPTNSDLYLARAYDYALVQDFNSAVDDFSKAIFYGERMVLAYFSRANVRYKQLVSLMNNHILTELNKGSVVDKGISEKRYSHEYEMIMRDYDKVIELQPDFAFAWYNRANLLAEQKDFQSAIANYSNAIDLRSDFGEAYYNRGLTYIYTGQTTKGIEDLSKAGELGIYKAYVALKKIRK